MRDFNIGLPVIELFFRGLEVMDQPLEMKQRKSGTTTVGVLGKDCVVLAADMKATMGNMVADLNATKIYALNKRIAITIAGGMGDNQVLVRFLKSHAKLFEIERDTPMTPKAMVTFLSNILSQSRYYPFLVQQILGGFNSKPELFNLDAAGAIQEVYDYTATGSGSEFAMGVLDTNYKKGMKKEDCIRLVVRAVKVSKKLDIFTGGRGVKVIVIDSKGVSEIDEKELEKLTTSE